MIEKIKTTLSTNDYIIVIDTSSYLDLYRYSPIVKDTFLDAIEKIKDKVSIPKVVEYEFFKNYKDVMKDFKPTFIFKELEKINDKYSENIIKKLKVLKDFEFPNIEKTIEEINDKIEQMEKILEDYQEDHEIIETIKEDSNENDKVIQLINSLKAQGKVLNGFPIEKIYQICAEGKNRYKNKIAPGYGDTKGKEGIALYSDLIIWFEIIELAKEQNKDIIFVTSDFKEWNQVSDTSVFPKEMEKEFKRKANKNIIGTNFRSFIDAVMQNYGIRKPEAIEKILEFTSKKYLNCLTEDKIIEDGIIDAYHEDIVYSGIASVNNEIFFRDSGEYFNFSDEDPEVIILNKKIEECLENEIIYLFEFEIIAKGISEDIVFIESIGESFDRGDYRSYILKSKGEAKLTQTIENFNEENLYDHSNSTINVEFEIFQEEYSYDQSELCVECQQEVGGYQNSSGEPICQRCMDDTTTGFCCAGCGLKFPHEEDTGGFCRACADEM
ncbi:MULTISPECIES: PIN-like domain-containing protein [Psychrilyobacter]|uniref:PIN like domain-containing protein n=1 Tax=Psychrilyobacter piezotolerans TaxID=2293438 RepID=A0ABX9KIP9_9FUSO|nr:MULTISPECIES: PIN-like domain-containing protein [Psychrilyobacter]MCS5420755.1 PIN domain-containing protein [Psychrilyobacter sp. S5]NDI77451.1 DUF4935 domain-containing protein [Psychrilyobacter piezotolerans]RDE63753.1 hypothetical protein DV867_05090 [Psychrilyobacter sp. S5]REI42097.1 hypothetical protein DYH56_05090 [Psychrilyobacter piezotolerans]